VGEDGLDFRLVHAWFLEIQDALKALAGQVARGLDGVNFVLRLNRAQFDA